MERKAMTVTRIVLLVLLVVVFILVAVGLPVYAWLIAQYRFAVYAPVSSPEALHIGAGHTDLGNDKFEDIRYMYFNGMDATDEKEYVDRVFCVYGKAVAGYRLQLAYTTNNQFSYEIYSASESAVEPAEYDVAYTTHDTEPHTYYYSTVGSPISGNFLNKTTVNGEDLASSVYHAATYDSYDAANVNKYAEPVYWQTTDVEVGNTRGEFVKYYILRVHMAGKLQNDKETDVICIAAKSFSVHES